MLKDPAVAKKVGPGWKTVLFDPPVLRYELHDLVLPTERILVQKSDPFAKLLDQVLDGKRTDEQVADAICLATVGRFPTEAEQKMALSAVAGGMDKRAGWSKVAATFAGTKEAQAHAEALKKK